MAQASESTNSTLAPPASDSNVMARPGVHANSRAGTAAPDFNAGAVIATVAVWEDVMGTRRSIQLRLKAIERADAYAPADLQAVFLHLEEAEKRCKRLIVREWRKHPLAEWAAGIHGLGEHSIAVVLAYLGGDVLRAQPYHWEGETLVADAPYERTVSQLRSYCGYGNPERKRQRGMSQEQAFACGKPLLKARLRLIAESFLKAKSPQYAPLYYEAKERYAERDWTDGHKHAAALRFVVKTFLKDLWLAARAMQAPISINTAPARATLGPIPMQQAPARAIQAPHAQSPSARAGQTRSDPQSRYARAGVS